MVTSANDLIVMDNGGTRIRIGHIRDDVPAANFEKFSSQLLCAPDAQDKLLALIDCYRKKHSLKLKAAVLGIPGVLDRTQDVITHCNNIPQLEGQGLKRFLSDALGCAVLFEQDIMLQLLGEWRAGAAINESSVFGAYFGTGIGAAYLLDGNPNNLLVQDIQAGHIPIMAEGRLCKCGNTDCVEAYACGHTLTEVASRMGCPVEKLFTYSKASPEQTELADELDQFICYQAYMLATVSTLLQPKVVVIGGGVPLMENYPRELLIANTVRHLQKPHPADTIRFVWASLGDSAVLHGALALLATHEKIHKRLMEPEL